MKRYSIYIPAKLMARIKPVETPDGEYVLYEDAKELEDMLRGILELTEYGDPYLIPISVWKEADALLDQ